jgi:hypothetical protein
MYTKDQLIHEATKVLKVSYYLIILLMIKIVFNAVVPTTTRSITTNKATGAGTETVSTRYHFFDLG